MERYRFTPEGNKIFKELQLEFIEKFIPKNDDDLHASKPIVKPHIRKAKKEILLGYPILWESI